MNGFRIVADWVEGQSGPEELSRTSAILRIAVGGHIATRVEDRLSKSVRTDVIVSAYPLALWLAGSWFRLRWEPVPVGERDLGWRMAHEMPAAGHGFVWPPLIFSSDGEAVEVICRPRQQPSDGEPIRYLEEFQESIPVAVFERGVDDFIAQVVGRLETIGVQNTELQCLWQELMSERRLPDARQYRRLEAELGFEPDEAPVDAVQRLIALASNAGAAATAEIAAACSGADPAAAIEQVVELAAASGVEVVVPDAGSAPPARANGHEPWERGRLLAQKARATWNIHSGQVDDQKMEEIFRADILRFGEAYGQAPIGLAVRDDGANRMRLLFRRRNRSGRRFEAARFLAEILIAPAVDRWLPATDSKTARQKLQRAFAAEFLSPIEELKAFLNGRFSEEAMEDAGEHFGLSPLAIRSHLANNDVIEKF